MAVPPQPCAGGGKDKLVPKEKVKAALVLRHQSLRAFAQKHQLDFKWLLGRRPEGPSGSNASPSINLTSKRPARRLIPAGFFVCD
jgi:hypothetical protein